MPVRRRRIEDSVLPLSTFERVRSKDVPTGRPQQRICTRSLLQPWSRLCLAQIDKWRPVVSRQTHNCFHRLENTKKVNCHIHTSMKLPKVYHVLLSCFREQIIRTRIGRWVADNGRAENFCQIRNWHFTLGWFGNPKISMCITR